MADLLLDQAQAALEASIARARGLGLRMNIALVDGGGNLKAFVRMDGALLGAADIAIRKAKTSRYFDMDSATLGRYSQPGGPLYSIEHSNGGLITFGGGIPLKSVDGIIAGAIGVAGGSVEQDEEVASAGALAYAEIDAPVTSP